MDLSFTCPICGVTKVVRFPSQRGRKYCSRACSAKRPLTAAELDGRRRGGQIRGTQKHRGRSPQPNELEGLTPEAIYARGYHNGYAARYYHARKLAASSGQEPR